MCGCICPSRLRRPPPLQKKKEKQQLTRRGGEAARGRSEGGEGTFARLRLFGREVLPAHLSARPPAAPHTRRRRRINRPRRAQEGRCNTQQPLIAGSEVSVMSLIHNIRHVPRYRSQFKEYIVLISVFFGDVLLWLSSCFPLLRFILASAVREVRGVRAAEAITRICVTF